ncbi:hypothetical protein EVAR_17485_1 [Eumeta japonica]|uniref:Uncharacterized protein n=1 Tax=Eumeta variegata TaxID=151549 RepID=A0A4C1ZHP1_EUMVA|nr:hypothetical protein EVAR_17485_1 [Eumeta japonica]
MLLTIESTRFDLDQGRINQRVFELSQRKVHPPCLRKHVKPSVADVVTCLPMVECLWSKPLRQQKDRKKMWLKE